MFGRKEGTSASIADFAEAREGKSEEGGGAAAVSFRKVELCAKKEGDMCHCDLGGTIYYGMKYVNGKQDAHGGSGMITSFDQLVAQPHKTLASHAGGVICSNEVMGLPVGLPAVYKHCYCAVRGGGGADSRAAPPQPGGNATAASAYPPCNPKGGNWAECVGVHTDMRKGKPRILCMVLSIKSDRAAAINIEKTWGKDCDRIVYFADFDDPSIAAVNVHAEWEGSAECLINKMAKGVQLVASLFAREYDWFVKADTDSFFIIENLRWFLLQHFPSPKDVAVTPHYLGERYNKYGDPKQAFNPGSGYVMNRAAFELLACSYRNPGKDTCVLGGTDSTGPLIKKHHKPSLAAPFCIAGAPSYDCRCEPKKKGNHEDLMAGICLRLWGVEPGDTRDAAGRDHFYAYFDAPSAYRGAPPNTTDTWFYKWSWARSDSDDYKERLASHPINFHRYNGEQYRAVQQAVRNRARVSSR
eukprot:g4979.t1